jgi:hypothetical protein
MQTPIRKLPHAHAYFDLQLRFAEILALRSRRPLGDTVALYTNFHRRFGLGVVAGLPATPAWVSFASRLDALPGHAERLAWTLEVYHRSAPEMPPPGRHVHGCFACDPPDRNGAVRIHFGNRDNDGESPLCASKIAQRRGELRAMFGLVRTTYPAAVSVRGGSWLYHLEAYRRLFPAAYVASRRQPERVPSLQGYSSWGQFLDHRGWVRPGPRARFLDNLETLDPLRIAAVFPLPALEVAGDIAEFYAQYGVTAPGFARS